jgi:phosphoribosylformylglycinamidine cyclo-ligase
LPPGLDVSLDLSAVPVLPVFKWLAATGGISTTEMLRTFNCGVGMVAVVDRDLADAAIERFAAHGEKTVRLGEVVISAGGARVVYRGQLDLTW